MASPQDETAIGYTFEEIEKMANVILERCPIRPSVGIICGTGLGGLADAVENPNSIPYEDIPGFPLCTVQGHHGKFVIGHISGKPVILMIGRFHYYEGYPMWKVAMPVRVMKLLGVKTLVVTNAAGGLNAEYKMGDIMIIKDHIDLPSLTGNNALRGRNDERFGPRFQATNSTYDKELREKFKDVASQLNVTLREGVYAMESGPTFVTLMETHLLRMIGADAIGMSTIPECVVGKHSGMRVFAFSLITDEESQDEDNVTELTHEAVLNVAREKTEILQQLMRNFLASI